MPNLFLQPTKSLNCLQAETDRIDDLNCEAQLLIIWVVSLVLVYLAQTGVIIYLDTGLLDSKKILINS
jgi:cytochrome b subunit of formate dehydrogenase